MSEHEILEQLRAMTSLEEVRDEVLQWLAVHVVEVQLEAGREFITEGDTGRECFLIVSGEAEVTRNGTTLGITGPGEPEGEVALFLGVPRTATTTAITEVAALRLDAADYDQLCANNSEVAEHLKVAICRHLARRFGLPSFAGVSEDG
jgi:CRP-like cAMP-binding protein